MPARCARWDDAPRTILELMQSPSAITARQQGLQKWYKTFMQNTLLQIEQVLEQQQDPTAGSTCDQ
jgi:hypothetical protein